MFYFQRILIFCQSFLKGFLYIFFYWTNSATPCSDLTGTGLCKVLWPIIMPPHISYIIPTFLQTRSSYTTLKLYTALSLALTVWTHYQANTFHNTLSSHYTLHNHHITHNAYLFPWIGLQAYSVYKLKLFFLKFLSGCCGQLFQVGATVCHCSTSFKVKIQLDHFCIGDGSYIDIHKFIWA